MMERNMERHSLYVQAREFFRWFDLSPQDMNARGEILERSVTGECRIFHALSIAGLSADHVLITRSGIFAICASLPDLTEDISGKTQMFARSLAVLLKERTGGWNRVVAVHLTLGISGAMTEATHSMARVASVDALARHVNELPELLEHEDICRIGSALQDILRDAKRLEASRQRAGIFSR
jgi:hypothetical protein